MHCRIGFIAFVLSGLAGCLTAGRAVDPSAGGKTDDHHHDPAAVHGMAMIGESRVFLSHLPMFHRPHDYQVLLEVELSAELRDVPAALHTFVPDPFELA